MLSALVAVLIAGCDSESGPGPEIHDSKYVGVSEQGEVMSQGEQGPCALDQFTGLIWEVKAADGRLRSSEHTYSWYNPNEHTGPELDYRGVPNGGECVGSDCDTHAYVSAVNEAALCGYSDWRMPSRDELGSISDPRKTQTPPTINTVYFPNTQAGEYWSGNDYQFQHDAAWWWGFGSGLDRVEWKRSPRHGRLVRGESVYLERSKD